MMPNVGNWRDEGGGVRRLCGGCKVRITLANPRIREGLQREFTAVLKHIVEEDANV